MPRLIVLNGPPGCGKSTIAQLFADDHPLALNLDIDRLRSMLGGWQSDLTSAGLLARACALAAARVHLAAGHDVVVPQFLGRVEFLEQVERLGREVGAAFVEIVLLDTKANSLARYAERTRATARPEHVEADSNELAVMYDRLVEVMRRRTHAKIVPTRQGDTAETYRRVLDVIDST